jgi:hypothetical protein
VACDRKSMTKPNLRKPKPAWKTPAKKVAVKASRRYNAGCVVGFNSLLNKVPSKSDTTATGPIARCLELPKTE